MIYLDTSALVKLVVRESGTDEMSDLVREVGADQLTSSVVTEIELVRAARRHDSRAVQGARAVMGLLSLLPLTSAVTRYAADLAPPSVRSLDAIHVASAASVPGLRALVTYDRRLADAAGDAGLIVWSPGA